MFCLSTVFSTLAISGRGQAYYLTPAFPILFASGAVWIEGWGRARSWLVPACAVGCGAAALLLLPIRLPLLTPSTFLCPEIDVNFGWTSCD